ncbi:hypothetical protein M6D93_04490 [Jatrophihabitans telluris]|uniref:DUF4397 domain-containing protein n=1 Tax=Jatrophihabitans telluris TaxID=2038343 RepID=A0ABY4R298_9ACTN|nr:hypothetical protein [Jatrophihabitans telluris]UQX89265.1 hypothetical protein M6D93_04490 [Jatrophihabitans telluris]
MLDGTPASEIRCDRQTGIFGALRRLTVFVDEVAVAKIGLRKMRARVKVEPGSHKVRVASGSASSGTLNVDVPTGAEVRLVVLPGVRPAGTEYDKSTFYTLEEL